MLDSAVACGEAIPSIALGTPSNQMDCCGETFISGALTADEERMKCTAMKGGVVLCYPAPST